jgi:hypothetical protein
MKEIDYKKLYLEHYKKLPISIFWGTLITLSLGAIVTGLIFIFDSEATIGLCILAIGLIVAVADAYFNLWISSVLISQKVIVADSLLSMSGESDIQKTATTAHSQSETAKDSGVIAKSESCKTSMEADTDEEDVEKIYQNARHLCKNNTVESITAAIELFEKIKDQKNVAAEIMLCRQRIRELNNTQQSDTAKNSKNKKLFNFMRIALSVVSVILLGIILYELFR